MPRKSTDDWDTPGGHGGREALEELAWKLDAQSGNARALQRKWREAVDELADGRAFKATVNPAEFNVFRRTRLSEGITKEQLAESFKIFVTAVLHGRTSVRHRDLWRAYAASWARWVAEVPPPPTRPLKDRQGPSNWQR